MKRKSTKIKVRLFSIIQFVRSVVPINELAHTNINVAENTMVHRFLVKGTLSFEIAMVKLIKCCLGYSIQEQTYILWIKYSVLNTLDC